MQCPIRVNQPKAFEWGLNVQQAMLFAFIYENQPCRNMPDVLDDGLFVLSKSNIVDEMPLVADKPDTAYRLMRALSRAGVIEMRHGAGCTMVRVTNKGALWEDFSCADITTPVMAPAKKKARKKIIPKHFRWAVFQRDGWACLRCGCSDPERLRADHVVPESKGGEMSMENLQTLCMSCNTWKATKEIDFRVSGGES